MVKKMRGKISMEIADLINQYGVPTVVAVGMSYFIYYIWKFVTTEILPVLGATLTTLIALIDRIRMLDNDMIRLDQKIHTVMELQEQEKHGKQEKEKKKNEK
jgi:hypothetical protein